MVRNYRMFSFSVELSWYDFQLLLKYYIKKIEGLFKTIMATWEHYRGLLMRETYKEKDMFSKETKANKHLCVDRIVILYSKERQKYEG